MIPVLVDSNVILDVATGDPVWCEWSSDHLRGLAERAILVINPIIYAEVSIGFDRIEGLEEALPASLFRRDPLPWRPVSWLARVFSNTDAAGGSR